MSSSLLPIPEYENNRTYRQAIRTIIGMPNPEYIHLPDASDDEETGDEQYYDESHMTRFLDEVQRKTTGNVHFNELYELAAACMFSVNHDIGLAVLLSYDYLAPFYRCLQCYYKTPDDFTEQNENYMYLKKRLM